MFVSIPPLLRLLSGIQKAFSFHQNLCCIGLNGISATDDESDITNAVLPGYLRFN